MGTTKEANLGGTSSLDTLATKALELLDRWYASKQQPKPERKTKPGTKGKAETKPLTSTGSMTMTQVAAEAQREERVRLSRIYKAGRAVGCSSDFLGKLVEQEIPLEQAYGAIINNVDERKGKAQAGVFANPQKTSKVSHEPTASVALGSPEKAELIAKQEWAKSRDLQEEFDTVGSYVAFKKHEKHIKIIDGKVVKGSRDTR
jgi:hypothetical protein